MKPADISDRGYDPLTVGIGMEWLAQYARFLRRSPELADNLAQRPDEFELVPIPKVLLNRLAVPGILGSGNLGEIDAEMRSILELDLDALSRRFIAHNQASQQAAFDRIHEFAAKIEAGDVDAASNLLSPRFINQDGDSAAEVKAVLDALVQRTCDRRLQVLSIEEKHTSDTEVVAGVSAMWSAARHDHGAGEISEAVSLEMVLERQPEGDWKISGLRSV